MPRCSNWLTFDKTAVVQLVLVTTVFLYIQSEAFKIVMTHITSYLWMTTSQPHTEWTWSESSDVVMSGAISWLVSYTKNYYNIFLVKNVNTNAVSHYVEILFVQTNGDHIVNLNINGKLDGIGHYYMKIFVHNFAGFSAGLRRHLLWR